MPSMKDSEDAFLYARTRFVNWREKFESEWYRALQRTQIGAVAVTLPPEFRARLTEQDQRVLGEVMKSGGRNGR